MPCVASGKDVFYGRTLLVPWHFGGGLSGDGGGNAFRGVELWIMGTVGFHAWGGGFIYWSTVAYAGQLYTGWYDVIV